MQDANEIANDNTTEKPRRNWSTVRRTSNRQINIRLNAEEAAQLDAIVEQAGVSYAGYMKAATFNCPIPKASRRVDVNAVALRQLLGQMGKVGSNANQLAKAANTGVFNDYLGVKEALRDINRNLTEMRVQLLTALNVEP